MKIKVLVLGKIHKAGLELFKNNKQFELILETDKPKNILELSKNVNAIIVRMTPINKELIDKAKDLKLVSRHGVGYNTVDVKELSLKNIPLTITEDVNSIAVSEHAFAMMISFSKSIINHDMEVRRENFKIRDEYKSYELCKNFGMKVLVADKFINKSDFKSEYEFSNNFEDFISDVDFISLHSPHNPKDPPMFSNKQFNKMKNTSIIINTSRGDLINENDLIKALKEKKIAGACLDVFNPEPPSISTNELLNLDNVILSPHSAAYTKEAVKKMSLSCCQNVIDYFNGNIKKELIVNLKEIQI
jgi:D-3-phosphoglycerate dehydrogenase / 2-oxoglutarate reductase